MGLDEEQKRFLLFAVGGIVAFLIVMIVFRKRPSASAAPATSSTPEYIPTTTENVAINSYNQGQPPAPTNNPPAQSAPWWASILHTTAQDNAPADASYFTVTKPVTTAQLASMFGLKNGWQDIAYNPHNRPLLPAAFAQHGNNVIPAGTTVWLTRSTIQPTSEPQSLKTYLQGNTGGNDATGGSGFEPLDNMALAPLPY